MRVLATREVQVVVVVITEVRVTEKGRDFNIIYIYIVVIYDDKAQAQQCSLSFYSLFRFSV